MRSSTGMGTPSCCPRRRWDVVRWGPADDPPMGECVTSAVGTALVAHRSMLMALTGLHRRGSVVHRTDTSRSARQASSASSNEGMGCLHPMPSLSSKGRNPLDPLPDWRSSVPVDMGLGNRGVWKLPYMSGRAVEKGSCDPASSRVPDRQIAWGAIPPHADPRRSRSPHPGVGRRLPLWRCGG